MVSGNFDKAVQSIILFCLLKFCTSFFKEMQSAMYLKVKQQATIELAELIFSHVHNLSLHWHLSKKTGNTIRVMDRGFDAADKLGTYLFLNLFPALSECLAVMLLFLFEYGSYTLSLTVFGGVFLFVSSTIFITKYRKRMKEKANTRDNQYHEIATGILYDSSYYYYYYYYN